jgi:hypothetical protein
MDVRLPASTILVGFGVTCILYQIQFDVKFMNLSTVLTIFSKMMVIQLTGTCWNITKEGTIYSHRHIVVVVIKNLLHFCKHFDNHLRFDICKAAIKCRWYFKPICEEVTGTNVKLSRFCL